MESGVGPRSFDWLGPSSRRAVVVAFAALGLIACISDEHRVMVDALQEVAADTMGDSLAPELDGGLDVEGGGGDDGSAPDTAGDTGGASAEVEDTVRDEVGVVDTSVAETFTEVEDEVVDTHGTEDTTVAETADTDGGEDGGVEAPEGFVHLAGGTFFMGGPAGEPGREADEVQR